MTPIGRLHWLALGAALGLPALGCDGCFGLDKYELVPSGSTTSTSGTGGSTPSCPTPATTMLFATYPLAPGSGDPAGDACAAPSVTAPGGGLALVALGPDDGACLARSDIARPAGGSLEALARVSAGPASAFLLAARYRGGAVTLPPSCADSTPTVVDEAPGASDGLFVARVAVTGTELCTRWVRRVYTTAPGATIVVGALDGAGSGPVALAGALDGAVGHFEDGPTTTDATGGAFVARYDENGALEGVSTFGSAADAALGLARYETGWLVSGGVRAADPACHGCSGESNLAAVTGSCQGGAGGTAGAGGASGTAGTGGTAGAGGTGGSPNDALNAFTWTRQDGEPSCMRLASFGRDAAGDAQLGFGLDARSGTNGCEAYWTGLAGRGSWLLAANDPSSALFDAGGSVDGFVARFDGGSPPGCLWNGAPSWSVRLTPTVLGAAAWGERVRVEPCAGGESVVTARVTGGGGGRIELHRCGGGGCETDALDVTLPSSSGGALAVLGLGPTGSLDWRAAFGPVAVDPSSPWLGAGAASDGLALEPEGDAYLAFTTTGPLVLSDLEPFGCDALVAGAGAGTYVVRLRSGGFIDRAMCTWVRRFGP